MIQTLNYIIELLISNPDYVFVDRAFVIVRRRVKGGTQFSSDY